MSTATGGAAPISEAEKHATAAAATAANAAKQRSCVTCRQRKVRCDKLSPCSNCRRADIPCVLPSAERPPRWARRLKQQQQHQQQQQPGHSAGSSTQSPLSNAAPFPSAFSSAGPLAAHNAPAPGSAQDPSSGSSTDVNAVLDRLKHLEALVRDLNSASSTPHHPPASDATLARAAPASSQLVAASAASAGARGAAFGSGPIQERFGRLILDDDASSRSRYVSSGFWSKINDELDVLRAETGNLAEGGGHYSTDDESDFDDDEDEPQSFSPAAAAAKWPVSVPHDNAYKTAAERSAFFFGHNLQPALGDAADYRPLPSQIPFLFQVYIVNVNMLSQVVHVPTINKVISSLLGDTTAQVDQQEVHQLTPATEALMFAIYYAAVVSMEDEDVVKNFAMSGSELSLKYRMGFEMSLAKADFLNTPDLEVVQALLIFLMLCRRYDSPRFVWMMTGLVIRMAQSLGLQRDGSNFGKSLSPYEVEIRRRVWWTICVLDIRASEDQGTELTITPSAFDTRLPLNINDSDINPDTKETPPERNELTDMTYALLNFEVGGLAQRMMASAAAASKQAQPQGELLLQEQNRMLDEVYQKLESVYLRHSPDTSSVIYWTSVTITRLFMAKMTLILNLPRLLHDQKYQQGVGPSDSEELRTRLLSSAIEVSEYNDALKTERACRRWRWLCETYTQWHTIAFLLMETGRRPWDPAVERAWVALHSPYLIPAPPSSSKKHQQQQQQQQQNQSKSSASRATSISAASAGGASNANTNNTNKSKASSNESGSHFFWQPLRRLLARARRHRASELVRLRADTKAARSLEIAYDIAVAEGRSRPLSNPGAVDIFRDRWRRLVGLEGGVTTSQSKSPPPTTVVDMSSSNSINTPDFQGGLSPAANIHSGLRSFRDLTELEYTSLDFPAPNSVDAFIFGSTGQLPRRQQQQQQQQQKDEQIYPQLGDNDINSAHSVNGFDPWRIWGGTEPNNSTGNGGGGNIVNDTSLMFAEDLDVEMDVEPSIDWDNWFASTRDFS